MSAFPDNPRPDPQNRAQVARYNEVDSARKRLRKPETPLTGIEQMNRELERWLLESQQQKTTMTVAQWRVAEEAFKAGWRAHRRAHRSKTGQRKHARERVRKMLDERAKSPVSEIDHG